MAFSLAVNSGTERLFPDFGSLALQATNENEIRDRMMDKKIFFMIFTS
jgi:hypothetical protein